MFDCGEGTQNKLFKYKLPIQQINKIFISHLHGDHYLGIFGLLNTMDMLKNSNDISIYAPEKLNSVIQLNMLISEHKLSYNINFIPLTNQTYKNIYEDDIIEISAFPLNHNISTWGFKVTKKPKTTRKIDKLFIEKYNPSYHEIKEIKEGKDYIDQNGHLHKNNNITTEIKESFVFSYCLDTKYDDSIIEYIMNSDVLYYEATFTNKHYEKAENRMHRTASEAAIIAKKANVKKLILTHFSSRYKDLSELLDEAKSIFPNTEIAEEGRIYKF